ncbi:hypothetical protein ACLI4Y_08645 [Natrialbaceae archaeon A-CW3]
MGKYNREGIRSLLNDGARYMHTRSTQYISWKTNHVGETDADVRKMIYINPLEIQNASGEKIIYRDVGRHLEQIDRPDSFKFATMGDVLAGEWDRNLVPFEHLTEYKSIKNRFEKCIPWKDTQLYSKSIERIGSGESVFGCDTEDELLNRFEYIDELYCDIRDQGYVRNNVHDDGYKTNWEGDRKLDEVTIDIGRDGELLYYTNGRHRLSIAKILGIDKIPVLVRVRHEGWQHIRNKIKSSKKHENTINHPDLNDIVNESKTNEE